MNEAARKLLAEIHHGVLCLEQAERHASIVASALRAQYVAGLEAAALLVEGRFWVPNVSPQFIGSRIRELAEQAKREG